MAGKVEGGTCVVAQFSVIVATVSLFLSFDLDTGDVVFSPFNSFNSVISVIPVIPFNSFNGAIEFCGIGEGFIIANNKRRTSVVRLLYIIKLSYGLLVRGLREGL